MIAKIVLCHSEYTASYDLRIAEQESKESKPIVEYKVFTVPFNSQGTAVLQDLTNQLAHYGFSPDPQYSKKKSFTDNLARYLLGRL